MRYVLACVLYHTQRLQGIGTCTVLLVIPASFLLDPAMSKAVNNKVLPLWGSLRSHDQEAVLTLLKRLAGNGKRDAVIADLMQSVAVGFANKDWAHSARVSRVVAEYIHQPQKKMV